jgi:4-diphosphocytidyl-2-C-methyl-D-erythritol kinase
LRRHIAIPFAVKVEIHKHIPVGSGLGGGSSDAASLLKFLNRALGSPLDTAQLTDLGAQIGADVPFFITGKPARVRGIGEFVEPLDKPLETDLVVCWSGTHLSTSEVFAEADRLQATKPPDSLTRRRPESNIADFVDGRRPISELLVNDLEEAAARICPEVRALKQELLTLGALGASMTGSGSAVFGICSDRASAERMAAALQRRGLRAWPTRTLAASPEVEC